MRDLKDSRQPWSKSLLVCGVACMGTLVAPGCNGPTGQFSILHNQVPAADCAIPAEKNATYRGAGVLDLRIPALASSDAAYLLFPLLQNDLPADADDGASPNRIALSGFEIDLAAVQGPDAFVDFFSGAPTDPDRAALVHYMVPWSGSVEAGGGNTAATANVFPVETALRLRSTGALTGGATGVVDATVRAVGRTLAGSVRSDPFRYPIEVCDGCLIRRTAACPLSAPVLTGGICNPAQDDMIDCCMNGTALVCPATVGP